MAVDDDDGGNDENRHSLSKTRYYLRNSRSSSLRQFHVPDNCPSGAAARGGDLIIIFREWNITVSEKCHLLGTHVWGEVIEFTTLSLTFPRLHYCVFITSICLADLSLFSQLQFVFHVYFLFVSHPLKLVSRLRRFYNLYPELTYQNHTTTLISRRSFKITDTCNMDLGNISFPFIHLFSYFDSLKSESRSRRSLPLSWINLIKIA